MLCAERVSNAIKSGVNQKPADGHNLYLVVKNGKESCGTSFSTAR